MDFCQYGEADYIRIWTPDSDIQSTWAKRNLDIRKDYVDQKVDRYAPTDSVGGYIVRFCCQLGIAPGVVEEE